MVYVQDSKSCGAQVLEGSNPSLGIIDFGEKEDE